MQQVANSFDWVTIGKIIRGGLMAAAGSLTLALLGYLGTVTYSNPTLTVMVSFVVPFLTNMLKEYLAGIQQ